MEIILSIDQRFLIPLENEHGTYLLVEKIFFNGDNSNHYISQIVYKGTKIEINMENGDTTKQEDYSLVVDESFNVEYSND